MRELAPTIDRRARPRRTGTTLGVNPPLVEALRSLADAFPIWRDAVAGPVNALRIELMGGGMDEPRRRFRPTDVLVSPNLVLTKRLSLPHAARKELRQAIDLLIRSETPFAPDELLIQATKSAPMRDGMVAYAIWLVPRITIKEALLSAAIPEFGVRRVAIDPAAANVEFTTFLGPMQRWLRRSWIIPLTILAVTSYAWAVAESTAQDQRFARLDGLIADELSLLREASRELEGLRAQRDGGAVVVDALENSISAYRLLADVRAALPLGVEVGKIEVRGNAARLLLESSDVLLTARQLAEELPGRRVTTDGATTVKATGAETATIVVSGNVE